MNRIDNPRQLEQLKNELIGARDASRIVIRVCMTGCKAKGADKITEAFRKELETRNLSSKAVLVETGCHGFCSMAPVMVMDPLDVFYCKMTPEDVPEIVEKTVMKGELVERLLYLDPSTEKRIEKNSEIPFYKYQKKIVLRNCGKISPVKIEDYIAENGYAALAKCLSLMSSVDVVEEVFKSGLRGRGGAGFSTGLKWRFANQAKGEEKYMVCNADEGDPGAFMDRAVLEGDPHTVLEGMAIAAYAIGATKGYVYCRAEYPIAVRNVGIAIQQAEEAGLLGDNILGSGFSFHVKVKEGAGAFVCGEETALLASIEGKRGMPRTRPPFPINSGLWGHPTLINNVETLANISPIILQGAEWYASIGTEKSKGTKIFALAGMINNTGLVEVPMGITLRDIIYKIGGGIPKGGTIKAALTGGPSGGCIPPQYLDLPLDYDSLNSVGAIMGSGGLIVMDATTCIVDIARYFLTFTQSESCGKCVPCRMGTKRMLEMLTRISEGKGEMADLDSLIELAESVKDSSLCGLGQTAPNPVLTTLKYFREEYREHIEDKRCKALKCKALLTYTIDQSPCTKCHLCARSCPVNAISGEVKERHEINHEKCISCGICHTVCPSNAIRITSGDKKVTEKASV